MSETQLSSWTQNNLGRILACTVSRYLQSAEHRREFETWYEKTYGKKYVWKKVSPNSEISKETTKNPA